MFNSVLHTCNGWSFRSFSDSFNHPINSDHKNITKSVHQEVLDCFSPKIGRQEFFLLTMVIFSKSQEENFVS